MATPDEQWWDAQAGEYVLGTLRGAERDVFEKILKVDEEAQNRVLYWQEVLSAMDKNLNELTPPTYIFPEILARIKAQRETSLSTKSHIDRTIPDNVETLEQRTQPRNSNALWKGLSTFAIAATLIMAVFLFKVLNTPIDIDTKTVDAVSIVQNEQKDSIWLLNADSGNNELLVVALNPPTLESNQSHQLWIVKPNDAGVESVGILPSNVGESVTVELPIPIDETQLFAVSLEPLGGSPNATPSGPVLYTGAIINTNSP